jgi:hypothetical protein
MIWSRLYNHLDASLYDFNPTSVSAIYLSAELFPKI